MKINPISFRGTYCLPAFSIRDRSCSRLLSKTDKYDMVVDTYFKDERLTYYVHIPSKYDKDMIKTFNKLKIPYLQVNQTEAMSSENIVSRIRMSNSDKVNGNILAEVSTKKLDELLRIDNESYIGHNLTDVSQEKYNRFSRYLRTNQPIIATSLYFKENENGQMVPRIRDGRHRFAVLRDLGIEKIPVSIDRDSIEFAKEIELI